MCKNLVLTISLTPTLFNCKLLQKTSPHTLPLIRTFNCQLKSALTSILNNLSSVTTIVPLGTSHPRAGLVDPTQ